ncbi:hypothetical protein NC651_029760 [Populus alba x Populus x berolinensis]|nr:hypothetical protein NC651_029760 [Populus alba x Populus x berolinensis]
MASNLNTLPEPLGLVIEEFAAAGGGGGNLGFWKGFGGGRFDGWGRKGKMNSGFLGFLVVSGLGLTLFLFGGELKIDVVSGVLVLSLLGAVLVKGFKRGIKDWILGLCFFGVLLGLGLKKGEMQKWVERCRVRSPVLVLMKGKRRHVIAFRGSGIAAMTACVLKDPLSTIMLWRGWKWTPISKGTGHISGSQTNEMAGTVPVVG